MTARRWLALIAALLLVSGAVVIALLPELVRHVAVARLRSMTGREVAIDRVDVSLLARRVVVHGLRVSDGDEPTPLAALDRLEIRLHLSPLLRGHIGIRDLRIDRPSVHVVRTRSGLNISDLVHGSGSSGGPLDVTVDRMAIAHGTVVFDDRALPTPQTWTSERIDIDGRNLSTVRSDGTAIGTSITAGAPVSLEMHDVRLRPIHFRAQVKTERLDLGVARMYLPPDAPVIPERGQLSTLLTAEMDARNGVTADVDATLDDLLIVTAVTRDPVVLAPALTARLTGLSWRDDRLRVGRLEVASAGRAVGAAAGPAGRVRLERVAAAVSDITWPVTMPGQLDMSTALATGGVLRVTGALRPPPDKSRVHLMLSKFDIEPWSKLLPMSARVAGTADADLQFDEVLSGGLPPRVAGTVGVNQVSVRDGRGEVMAARRIEAADIDLSAPNRVVLRRIDVTSPRMRAERAQDGSFPIRQLVMPVADRAAAPADRDRAPASRSQASGGIDVRVSDIAVRDGRIAWRDASVQPAAQIDVTNIQARARDVGWPLHGPVAIDVTATPPGGGRLGLSGRVGVEPVSADLHVRATGAELAPYQPYASTPVRISGRADLDLAIALPPGADGRATVRGRAAVADVDVRDGQRSVMQVARAAADGIDVDWPARVDVRSMSVERPWILVERDGSGRLQLSRMLPGSARQPGATARRTDAAGEGGSADDRPSDAERRPAVSVTRLRVERGGARVVDRSIAPPFAVDVDRLAMTVQGASTAEGTPPARVELAGRIGGNADVALRGTVAVGAPLRVDVNGEVRRFAVPRANPYLLHQVAWEAREGWVTSTLRCRIDGDALNARTDIRIGQLELARAGTHDEAQARIGLPLGMLVSLIKDSHGEIRVALPIGGRLSDPKFDLSEAIWSAVRTVAIKAVTLPVSWIGHVRFTRDAKIERIDVDPLRFDPGTTSLTDDGAEQTSRVAAYLQQTSDIRIALRPVLAVADATALRRSAVQHRIERLTREGHVSASDAAARLYGERFPGRPLPSDPEVVLQSLTEAEAVPQADLRQLAERRIDGVRTALARAGIPRARLLTSKAPEALEPGDARVEIDLVDADRAHEAESPFRKLLRRFTAASAQE